MPRIFAASLMVFAAFGQTPAPSPTFEVASVKPSHSTARGAVEFSKAGDRFTATNMPLGALILIAFNLTVRQISGPDQAFSERYDIVAKAQHPVPAAEMSQMLQALLADRFKLVFHREIRDVPVYSLTIAKGGPKLHRSDPPDGEIATPRTPAHAGGTESSSGHLAFRNESMADFAWALSRTAGIGDRVVVDRTGLEGTYDFELAFERDSAPPAGTDSARLGPPIFSALQEQLGLKLESARAPVEFLIIDRVEKPTEN
jgi:uncharacterized protein (TIGR03435 family)